MLNKSDNIGMEKSVADIRDQRVRNLRVLISRFRTAAEFARTYGLDPTYISQLLTGYRPIGEVAARKIELACGLPTGSLDGEENTMLTEEQRAWIALLSQLTDEQKAALRQVAETMAVYIAPPRKVTPGDGGA